MFFDLPENPINPLFGIAERPWLVTDDHSYKYSMANQWLIRWFQFRECDERRDLESRATRWERISFRKSKEESETRVGTWAQRKNYLWHSSRRLSCDNAHSSARVLISGPPSSRYLCAPSCGRTHASRVSPCHAHAARHEKFYYEVNRGECGRDSRFGYAHGNVVSRKQQCNGNTRVRARARMGEEISQHLILQQIYANSLSNDQVS